MFRTNLCKTWLGRGGGGPESKNRDGVRTSRGVFLVSGTMAQASVLDIRHMGIDFIALIKMLAVQSSRSSESPSNLALFFRD